MEPPYPMNPQEPPSRGTYPAYCNEASNTRSKRRLPTCIFDLHLDLPHPAAASADRARIVDPPVAVCPLVAEEMCHPANLSRLSRLAFPEYDDANGDALNEASAARGGGKVLTSQGRTCGAHLTKYDVYHVDFAGHHHTFSLLLSDGNTRVHGHVRRYLPPHADAAARMDVGRRRPRAMVLLTRAVGGERFYASVLKTAEAILVESQVNRRGCFAKKRDPARAFLHALFNRHATLIAQYAELRRHGLGLNFARGPGDAKGVSACETARAVMEANEGLFRIAMDKVESGGGRKRGHIRLENDTVQFHLPIALQPGFECLPLDATPDDAASPIVPLLRCIGPTHFVRLLSALLCERRIVLISKSVARLSVCVRAASAVLAQGLLPWKHILIPVVPPHMLKFLAVDAPYLVGILHKFAGRLGKLGGLSDVLCVNLDSAELKTLKMANARATVPDLLRKERGKSDSGPSAVECLARDLEEIVKADRSLWERDSGNNEKKRDNGNKPLDISEMLQSNAAPPTKRSILEKMRNPVKRVQDNAKRSEERRHGNEAVDAAVMFGRMIRATLGREGDDDDDTATQDDIDATHRSAPKYAAPVQDADIGSVEPSLAAENEGGEEDVRAALTCFFLHLHGDMGMYLSETHGTFWLDRRKFLLRKKQLGERENSPAFAVLQKLSASHMFALHAKGRIDDMSLTERDRSNIMPHHMPLFDVCSKYLAVHRLDFSLINIRRIVSKTVLACPRHMAVERHVAVRTRALALTEDAPFDGNVALAIAALVDECHECNTDLTVVMSVIWHRLNQTKSSMAILLTLHLLKNLLSHGPLTAITEALDGAGKIFELKSFSYAKSADLNRDVRQAADHVYGLLVDLSELFARRRRLAYSKARQRATVSKNQSTWSDYLARRLPLTIDARELHSLFRPEGMDGQAFGDDADGSIAPSVAASATPSVLALSRLKRESRFEKPPVVYDDEEDRQFFPAEEQHQVEGTVASGTEWLDDSEENRLASSDRTGDDLFSEQSLSSSGLNYEYDNMLASFNDAVSSSGSYVSPSLTGSYFGSERSGSPLPQARRTAPSFLSMRRITEMEDAAGDEESYKEKRPLLS